MLAVVVVALLALPYVIAPLYRFVDPVSTPMLWRWARGARVVRIAVPLERISPALPLTVIVADVGGKPEIHDQSIGRHGATEYHCRPRRFERGVSC